MNQKILIGIMLVVIIILILQLNRSSHNENTITNQIQNEIVSFENTSTVSNNEVKQETLNSSKNINLTDLDGNGKNYSFTYNGETFSATYTLDNWHIENSYKIKNREDIVAICQALIDIHPIHESNMVLYRTAEDMAYEWLQHNLAYSILPDDNSWKEHAKNVDLNPEDQGKNLLEMYQSRTGK